MIVGSESGKVFYYKHIDGNLDGQFEESDSLFVLINDDPFALMNGIRTAATMEDLDNDGYFDLIVGNYSGGLNYYYGQDKPQVSGSNESEIDKIDCELFPNPAKNRIYINFDQSNEIKDIHINVYNLMSSIVLKDFFSNTLDISLFVGNLPEGIYICEITLNGELKKRLFKRIIISR